MSDIVDALRKDASAIERRYGVPADRLFLTKAADEIERLRAELAEARSEVNEQARLLGKSAERELSLITKKREARVKALKEAAALLVETWTNGIGDAAADEILSLINQERDNEPDSDRG